MIRQAEVFGLISQLTGHNNQLAYSTAFVDYCDGHHETALLLSQLIYWSDKTKIPGGWIAKEYKDWYAEIRLSEYLVRRAAKLLEDDRKILETTVKRFNGFATVHFRMLREAFIESFVDFLSKRKTGFEKYSEVYGIAKQRKQRGSEKIQEPGSGPEIISVPVLENFQNQNRNNFSSGPLKISEPLTETNTRDLTETKAEDYFADSQGSQLDSKKNTGGRIKGAAPGRKKSDAPPVYKDAIGIYFQAYKAKYNVAPKFDAADGKLLKSILDYLKGITTAQSYTDALELFEGILAGWHLLPEWFETKMNIKILSNQMTTIIPEIRKHNERFTEIQSGFSANDFSGY